MSYFDNNATTPLHPAAREALVQALEQGWANPSSPYRTSAQIRASMEKCRESIASTLKIDPEHLTFTSGATEANNSVFSSLAHTSPLGSRVLLSPYEHPSVTEAAQLWFPDRVDTLTAQQNGEIAMEELSDFLQKEQRPVLVAVMAASNESGVIQPWREVARLCQTHGVLYHCDSTQLPGKGSLHDLSLCSFFVTSAHKFGGPKGIGWLVGEGASSLLVGGEQEKGRRGGTENYPAIISACTAWESLSDFILDSEHLSSMRNKFEKQMISEFPSIQVIGQEAPRLWNTSLFLMPNFENLRWVGKLDKLGFQISTGSACSTTKKGGSPIAQAMKLSPADSQHLLRVSSFHSHTAADWDDLFSAFRQAHLALTEESADSSVISF